MGKTSSRCSYDDISNNGRCEQGESEKHFALFNCGCSQSTLPIETDGNYWNMEDLDLRTESRLVAHDIDVSHLHETTAPYLGESKLYSSYAPQRVIVDMNIGLSSRASLKTPKLHEDENEFGPDRVLTQQVSIISGDDGKLCDDVELDGSMCSKSTCSNEFVDARRSQLPLDSEDEEDDDDDFLNRIDDLEKLPQRHALTGALATSTTSFGAPSYSKRRDRKRRTQQERVNDRDSTIVSSPTAASTGSDFSLDTVDVFQSPDGSCADDLDLLPSFHRGTPIQLVIKESYRGYPASASHAEVEQIYSGDYSHHNFFTYDPYFDYGEYSVSTACGRAYGKGLRVLTGSQYMSLQDSDNRIWAITRSRHTFIPSSIIYAPKPRYEGQMSTTHRPMSFSTSGECISVELFPWALVRKDGRRMDHDAYIHMVVQGDANTLLDGQFETQPSFRSTHGLDDKASHSHSVVYRVQPNLKEKPCCLVLRHSVNRHTFDVTIAPGIDPLLIICYLAVHSKMDLEPKLHFE